MKDEKKTKKQLIDELITLRRRIAELQSLGPERRQAEEVLRENEEKFRQLVETSPDAIFVHSDRKFVFVNPATVKLFGAANPGELIGRPIRDIIHPEYWKIIEKRDQQIEQKGKKAPLIEEKLLCLDGTTIYVEAAAVTFTYQGKSAVQVVLRDITERKKVEEALRESEKNFKELANLLPQIVFETDIAGSLTYVNRKAFDLFGYTQKDLDKGLNAFQMLIPQERDKAEKNIRSILSGVEMLANREYTAQRKDGSTFPIEVHSNPIVRDDKPIGLRGIIVDITERKKVEGLIKAKSQFLERLIYQSPLSTFVMNSEGICVMFNDAFLKLFSVPDKDLVLGKNALKEPANVKQGIVKYMKEALSGKIVEVPEIEFASPFGDKSVFVTSKMFPIYDPNANLTNVVVVHEDVTERKRAEEALQESEERYRVLVESSNQAIFTVDKSGLFLFMNVSAARQLGGEPKDFRGKTMGDLFPKEIANRQMAAIRKAMETASQSIIESESFIKGEQRWFETNIRPTRNSSGVFDKVLCVAADITERKRSEEALWESEERLSQIVQGSLIPTFVIDNKHVITHWNKVCEKLTGISADEIIGTQKQWRAFYSAQRPIMADLIVDNLSEEEIAKCYGSKCRKSAHLESAYEVEKFFPNLGERGKWLFFTAAPLRNVKGKVVGAIETLQDITERKRAEEKIKASLQEKEVLLREIHHRVKNNLQVITSLINFQARSLKDKMGVELLKELQNRIRSMSLVHEKLYRSQDLVHVSFKEYIQDLVKVLYRAHGVDKGKIALKIAVKDVSLGIDVAIPCGLIINELVSNALKHAFPEGQEGKIKISLHPINKSEVELIVSDNGVGIPEDVDFRKTESLGLHIVTILAEDQLHGKVEVDRTKGTTFKIKLRVK